MGCASSSKTGSTFLPSPRQMNWLLDGLRAASSGCRWRSWQLDCARNRGTMRRRYHVPRGTLSCEGGLQCLRSGCCRPPHVPGGSRRCGLRRTVHADLRFTVFRRRVGRILLQKTFIEEFQRLSERALAWADEYGERHDGDTDNRQFRGQDQDRRACRPGFRLDRYTRTDGRPSSGAGRFPFRRARYAARHVGYGCSIECRFYAMPFCGKTGNRAASRLAISLRPHGCSMLVAPASSRQWSIRSPMQRRLCGLRSIRHLASEAGDRPWRSTT